jgi:hypothetical protein
LREWLDFLPTAQPYGFANLVQWRASVQSPRAAGGEQVKVSIVS